MPIKDINQLIEVIKEVLAKSPVDFAYLYGSFAEGTPRSWSDIDLALIVNESLSQNKYLPLELDISKKIEANFPGIEVDARIFNLAPLNFKIQPVQTGRLIYSADETKRVEFETRVRDEYFDFLPLRQKFQRDLLANVEKGGLLWSTRKK